MDGQPSSTRLAGFALRFALFFCLGLLLGFMIAMAEASGSKTFTYTLPAWMPPAAMMFVMICAIVAALLARMQNWQQCIAASFLAVVLHSALTVLMLFVFPPAITFSTNEIVWGLVEISVAYSLALLLAFLFQIFLLTPKKGSS